MKISFVVAVFAAALLLGGCAGGGGGPVVTGPDPIIGMWKLTAINGSPAEAMSQVLVCDASGALVAGIDDEGSGSCAVGAWSQTSAGHYSYVTYMNDGEMPATNAGTLSGDTMTVPNVQQGRGAPATFTFTRVDTTHSSSDPLVGNWDLAFVNDGRGWVPAETREVSAQIAVHDAGLLTGGMEAYFTAGFAGTWTRTGTGDYDYTLYLNTGERPVQSGSATLSEYLEIPDFDLGSEGTSDVRFSRHVASYSPSDSILGRWALTAVNGGPPGVSWEFAFLNHGAFAGGMEDGDGTRCILGTWRPTGTTGAYDYIVYPYDDESAAHGTLTVSGNTLTLPNIVLNGGDPVTLTFSRD